MLSLIILAAGESSRMKSPKALLQVNSETFLQCIIRKAGSAGVHSIVIVTGPDHEAIAATVPPDVRCVRNENYFEGQISSLRRGILEIAESSPAVLVWPVDQPLVKMETVRHLISVFESEGKALTIPIYQGRRGHPVIYNPWAMASILNLQPNETGKVLQAAYSDSTTLVEVKDEGVTLDIDTPEDYRKYVTGG
jgi:molybdenum cofactor cytidylyltransferase